VSRAPKRLLSLGGRQPSSIVPDPVTHFRGNSHASIHDWSDLRISR
jgi:hypothetical protein